jgi:1-acyl-sn-glycerol-3-phosphate acyltransferase
MRGETGVPVVPVGIQGMYDSLFSKKKGSYIERALGAVRRPVTVRFGEPLRSLGAREAEDAVRALAR